MKRRLIEIDQALTVAPLIQVNLFQPPPKASKGEGWGKEKRVSMGLTDRRKTAQNLVDSRKNWKFLTVSRK